MKKNLYCKKLVAQKVSFTQLCLPENCADVTHLLSTGQILVGD